MYGAQQHAGPEAERSEASATDPQHWLTQMDQAFRAGQDAQALRCHARILAAVSSVELLDQCGQLLLRHGHPGAAADCFRAALAQDGASMAIRRRAGHCSLATQQFTEAVAHFQAVLDARPDECDAVLGLGEALLALKRYDAADTIFRKAVRLAPERARSYVLLGQTAEALRKTDEALAHYDHAMRRNPADLDLLIHIGDLLRDQLRTSESLAAYRQALEIAPDRATVLMRVGFALHALGAAREAENHWRRAVTVNPGHVEAYIALGKAAGDRGLPDEALAWFARALKIYPRHFEVLVTETALLERNGREDEARHRLAALQAEAPEHPQILVLAARLAQTSEERRALIPRLEHCLATAPLAHDLRIIQHFTLGALHDKERQYTEAFAHFHKGNETRHRTRPYEPERTQRDFARMREVFTPEWMRSAPRAHDQGARLVFIVGMPRSGTSLAEQILASHTKVYGAGELWDLELVLREGPSGPGAGEARYPDYIAGLCEADLVSRGDTYLRGLPPASTQAQIVTDKMPHNFQHIGMIALLFPKARIIHCQRDPVDTCWSCYMQNFGEGNAYSFDLAACGHYYQQYRQLMTHWQQVVDIPMLNLSYEKLVSAPEPTVRQLLAFCELDWEEACLRFHENRRVVQTASYRQVKEPFHMRSVGRAQAYRSFLGPLIAELSLASDKDLREQIQ